ISEHHDGGRGRVLQPADPALSAAALRSVSAPHRDSHARAEIQRSGWHLGLSLAGGRAGFRDAHSRREENRLADHSGHYLLADDENTAEEKRIRCGDPPLLRQRLQAVDSHEAEANSAAENFLDLGYIRFRLFHILLGVLNVTLLQRSLREHQFIACHLL